MAERWGVRSKTGEVGPLQVKEPKPRTVEIRDNRELRDNAGLRDLQAAIETAQASDLPGAPSSLVSTISVEHYQPSEQAIAATLAGM